MRIEYITVAGKPIVYHYRNKDMKHKPKCLNCGKGLKNIFIRENNMHKTIGFICSRCKTVFIDKKYSKIISINRIKVIK